MELSKDLENEKKEQKSIDWRDTLSQMETMRLLGLQSNSEETATLAKLRNIRKRSFSLDPEKRKNGRI
ncbi:GM26875 [Drosophila sechellia]|uniref:GM26875 n=1 Tax=Drosophila sechellia TaxID=7238 RepID=B4IHQ1_DROSE|nr:GM26875 [Drosophila sechellia]